jgi:hypothetical protein
MSAADEVTRRQRGPTGAVGGVVGWIWGTAIQGVLGGRPLGDPFSPGQTSFGPFFQQVRAAQIAQTPVPAPQLPVPAPRPPPPRGAAPPAVKPPDFYPPVPSPGPPYQPPPPGSGGSGSSGRPPPSSPGGGNAGMDPNAPPSSPTSTVVTMDWRQFVLINSIPYIERGIYAGMDWWLAGQREVTTRGGPWQRGRRRARARAPAQPAGRGDPFPPQGSPPAAARARARAPVREQPARLDTIIVRQGRMVDRFPGRTIGELETIRDAPVKPPPAPAKTPLWLTLLPIVGPSLLGFLQPAQGNRTVLRLTDPLTQPQPGNGNPFPLTGFQPAVQTYGAFGGTPGAVGTNTCECKAPRKKGRKKKRTVCYSGTFIERRDGTRKTKKRKVQCL